MVGVEKGERESHWNNVSTQKEEGRKGVSVVEGTKRKEKILSRLKERNSRGVFKNEAWEKYKIFGEIKKLIIVVQKKNAIASGREK